MIPLVLSVLILFGLPLALMIVFKASGAVLFFSMCVGVIAVEGVDASLVSTAGSLLPVAEGEGYVRLSLALVLLVIGALLSKGSVRKPTGLMLHSFVILLGAALLWSTLPELTGVSWLLETTNQYAWDVLRSFQMIIITTSFIASLLLMRQKHRSHDKHK